MPGCNSYTQQWRKVGCIVPPPTHLHWMDSHTMLPFADPLEGDRFRIYFSGRDQANRSRTGFVDIDINEPDRPIGFSDQPSVDFGPVGTFDEHGATGSWLVRHGGRMYLFYAGWNRGVSVPFRNALGVAISDDGCTFHKFAPGPVLDRSIYDPCFIGAACVTVDTQVWRMWYLSCVAWEHFQGELRHRYHIKYAESDDGIHWRRDGRVCIDFKDETEYAISRPCVIKDESGYKMWYSFRGEHYRIGYAESEDGLTWRRMDDVIDLDLSASGFDSQMIEYPFVFDHAGTRYMLYNGNGYGKTGIGLAILVS